MPPAARRRGTPRSLWRRSAGCSFRPRVDDPSRGRCSARSCSARRPSTSRRGSLTSRLATLARGRVGRFRAGRLVPALAAAWRRASAPLGAKLLIAYLAMVVFIPAGLVWATSAHPPAIARPSGEVGGATATAARIAGPAATVSVPTATHAGPGSASGASAPGLGPPEGAAPPTAVVAAAGPAIAAGTPTVATPLPAATATAAPTPPTPTAAPATGAPAVPIGSAVPAPTATLPPREPSLRVEAGAPDAGVAVGDTVALVLRVSNVGRERVDGFALLATGDWDKYADLRLDGDGTIERADRGLWIRVRTPVGPGGAVTLTLLGRATEEGRHRFTFFVYRQPA